MRIYRFAPLLLLFTAAEVVAAISLPALFSDHAVLQKAPDVPIWGNASPGENIEISIAGATTRAQADKGGKWRASLNLENLGQGPHELTVKGSTVLTVRDVVVGEVWLCSGQSNMEFALKRSDQAESEIAASANLFLRQFCGRQKASEQPEEELQGKWIVASSATSADFSAIGYYFGKILQQKLKAPIGLINCSWGGTPVEAWTSESALEQNEILKERKDREKREVKAFPAKRAQFIAALTAWLKEEGREDFGCSDPSPYVAEAISQSEWVSVKWPGAIAGPNLPSRGVVWLRKEFNLSSETFAGNEPLTLKLEDLRGFDTVYVNGQLIGSTSLADWEGEGSLRKYEVSKSALKPGRNILALRIFAPAFAPNLGGYGERLKLGPASLDGPWLAKKEYELPSASRTPPPPILKVPTEPSDRAAYLYNGMIHPLLPYAIRGVIWYQGENNTGEAFLYRTAFPVLIKDWRSAWRRENLPFYFCQLAGFQPKDRSPRESSWAELREAQTLTLQLPHTGQAVLFDLGEVNDVHPRNKRVVGERLALIALANDYGQGGTFSGPFYETMSVEEGKIRLRFKAGGDALVARELGPTYDVRTLTKETAPLVRNSPGSELEGFAICGADRKWVWAQAYIDGDSVLVWSPQIPKPVAVRYAWANNPTGNLYGQSGLPASPFRTDDFPAITNKGR